jgi:hypothetical protein
MKPTGPVGVITGAGAWARGFYHQSDQVGRLRKLGFVAGVGENLAVAGNEDRFGVSAVEQFSSASAARAELRYTSTANGPWTDFPVHGIPGARGFEEIAHPGTSGRNVAFADGDYAYIVGAGWNGGSANGVSRSTLESAALVLYHRVHGK